MKLVKEKAEAEEMKAAVLRVLLVQLPLCDSD